MLTWYKSEVLHEHCSMIHGVDKRSVTVVVDRYNMVTYNCPEGIMSRFGYIRASSFVMRHLYQDKLESARLVTRMLTENDIPIWADFFADKEAVEFLPSFVLSSNLDSAKHWVDKQLARYADNCFGLQALIDKKSSDLVGQCGLIKQEVDNKEEIEVGYHIFKKYWGQGFAPEAARLFIDYAFQYDLTVSVISIIDRKNIKSQRVAEKNGLAIEKETKWTGLDVYIYRINKHDYEKDGQTTAETNG